MRRIFGGFLAAVGLAILVPKADDLRIAVATTVLMTGVELVIGQREREWGKRIIDRLRDGRAQ